MLGVGGCDPSATAVVCASMCMCIAFVCVCVCVCCVLDQTLTPRKRPCFPYLTTTEHVSPWPQAALFMGFVCVCVCVCVCLCVCHVHCLPMFIVCLGRGATPELLLQSLSFSLLLPCNSENLSTTASFHSFIFFFVFLFPSISFCLSTSLFFYSCPVLKCAYMCLRAHKCVCLSVCLILSSGFEPAVTSWAT